VTAFLDQQSMSAIQGPPPTVEAGLRDISERYGTTDLGVVTICYDFAARVRSYELVAEMASRRA